MIGRGALGNPWIFGEIQKYLETGIKKPLRGINEIFDIMIIHLKKAINYYGKRLGILEMRKHLAWYIKGLPYSASVKNKLQQCKDTCSIEEILREYFNELSGLDY